jgi:hypothetical protein
MNGSTVNSVSSTPSAEPPRSRFASQSPISLLVDSLKDRLLFAVPKKGELEGRGSGAGATEASEKEVSRVKREESLPSEVRISPERSEKELFRAKRALHGRKVRPTPPSAARMTRGRNDRVECVV